MIAQSVALPLMPKTNLSVSIKEWGERVKLNLDVCNDNIVSNLAEYKPFGVAFSFPCPSWLLSFYNDLQISHASSRIGHCFTRLIILLPTDCNIAISTYSMVSFTGKRSWEAGEVSMVTFHLGTLEFRSKILSSIPADQSI